MTRAHRRPRTYSWMLLVLGLALVAGHGVILRYAWSRLSLSAIVLFGVAVLLVIKHLGLAGAFRAVLRRRSRL